MSERFYENAPVAEVEIGVFLADPRGDGSPTTPTGSWWDRFEPPAAYEPGVDVFRKKINWELNDQDVIVQTGQAETRISERVYTARAGRRRVSVGEDHVGFQHKRGGGGVEAGPWGGWEQDLAPAFAEIWSAVLRAEPGRAVQLVRLRYVNQLDLPSPGLKKYLRTLPEISSDTPGDGVAGFLLQLDIPQGDGVVAHLVQASRPGSLPGSVGLTLDLDIHWRPPQALPAAEAGVCATLDRLHSIENRLFESLLTDNLRDRMQARPQPGDAAEDGRP